MLNIQTDFTRYGCLKPDEENWSGRSRTSCVCWEVNLLDTFLPEWLLCLTCDLIRRQKSGENTQEYMNTSLTHSHLLYGLKKLWKKASFFSQINDNTFSAYSILIISDCEAPDPKGFPSKAKPLCFWRALCQSLKILLMLALLCSAPLPRQAPSEWSPIICLSLSLLSGRVSLRLVTQVM